MTSVRLGDLFESAADRLSVPEGTSDMSTLDAALAWAESGFYVLPISPASKHAGSVLGKGWPDKTSRDPGRIRSWFERSELGLALHVGKSGAIAFDVDRPTNLPVKLRDWLALECVPFQSTRLGQQERGHFLFAAPPGRSYGNSTGRLGSAWGEVRGRNGIIVVAPTPHAKAAEGGQYRWKRTGSLPILPVDLDRYLPNGPTSVAESVDLSQVHNFLSEHADGDCPEVVPLRLATMRAQIATGRSRHDATRNTLTWLLKESKAGLCSAQEVVESVLEEFVRFKPRDQWSSPTEFTDMVRWAVAQASSTPPDELAQLREGVLAATSREIRAWIEGEGNGPRCA